MGKDLLHLPTIVYAMHWRAPIHAQDTLTSTFVLLNVQTITCYIVFLTKTTESLCPEHSGRGGLSFRLTKHTRYWGKIYTPSRHLSYDTGSRHSTKISCGSKRHHRAAERVVESYLTLRIYFGYSTDSKANVHHYDQICFCLSPVVQSSWTCSLCWPR